MPISTKKQLIKEKIIAEIGSPHDPRCVKALRLIDSMDDSSIPVGYWFIKMKDFGGSPKLGEIINSYISNVKQNYIDGTSICLAGNQGTGKTMSSICILKAALKSNFTAHYTTASDMLTEMVSSEKINVRKTLREVDFLVIDELDSRFFVSDAQKELFSSVYESIFRFRAHNTMPTIICTNETENILNVFHGQAKQAIQSLNHQYLKVYPVVGIDYRKRIENGENVA